MLRSLREAVLPSSVRTDSSSLLLLGREVSNFSMEQRGDSNICAGADCIDLYNKGQSVVIA